MAEPFDFGTALRNLRRERGYTQKKLAEVLKLSETTISKYESNTAVPSFETVCEIAAWFHVSLDILAGGVPPETLLLTELDRDQVEIMRALADAFAEKNGLREKTALSKRYELLGRITSSLI